MAKYCKCVSEETMTEKRMEKNEEVKEEEMMGSDDLLRKRLCRMTCLAKVSTMGRRFWKCTLMDPRYCDWTVRQDRRLMWKLRYLNGKRIGKRMKEDDVEVKILEACCEETRRNWKRRPEGGECNGLTWHRKLKGVRWWRRLKTKIRKRKMEQM